MEHLYQCPLCKTSFGKENEFRSHYIQIHEHQANNHLAQSQTYKSLNNGKGVKYGCQWCQYETNRKSNYLRHRERNHENANGLALPQTNRVVDLPTVGYGGVRFLNTPQKSYTESLATERDSESSETNYRTNVVNESGKDFLDEDSDSMSSEHSEDNCDMEYITEKGHNILRRCG